MPGLKLITSNRLEILAGRLAGVLEEPLGSPFQKEIIVVQSKGMEHWVSMRLAQYHGICANYSFPFPNFFINDIFSSVLTDAIEGSHFDPGTMTWRIMDLLPGLVDEPGFEQLRRYLDHHGCELRLYQLSRVLADLFDQYLLFRPAMILGWENGLNQYTEASRDLECWQARLWKELSAGCAGIHRAALKSRFAAALSNTEPSMLPERVSVFGISYMPPFHMEVLSAVSSLIDVYLYVMNPCQEFWSDIRGRHEIERISMHHGYKEAGVLHLEEGNPMLASMGLLGRQFIDSILDLDPEQYDYFEPCKQDDMLGRIHNDILTLNKPGDCARHKVMKGDRSIQVHSCHSPMREVEVLYDNLLYIFDSRPDLKPQDILVMVPGIEGYAPFIHAVFDTQQRAIPFSIADRTMVRQSRLIEAFMMLLDIGASRMEASRVLNLLECVYVRKRFGIEQRHIALIQGWIEDTSICWGIDAQDRVGLSLPGFDENTFKAGLDRLLLGYAMPPASDHLFEGMLAYHDMEGEDAVVLGLFITFICRLIEHARDLGRKRTLEGWSVYLTEMMEAFIQTDEASQDQYQIIRGQIDVLDNAGIASGFEKETGLEVIRSWLAEGLGRKTEGRGFISGGVTFCEMLPMRSIPFKVICMLGMNHDTYPRRQRSSQFDLISRHPRPQDRSKRDDDLYLFLEAVLSARDILYISYIGRGIRDNSSIPPSVLVSTLMDYLDQGFCYEDPMPVSEYIMTRHALQAFNPVYFTDNEGYYSYSRENLAASKSLCKPSGPVERFAGHPLTEPGREWMGLDVETLCGFFRNPARYLLNKRLGIVIPRTAQALADTEPFELDGLDKYMLNQELVGHFMDGLEKDKAFSLIKASGRLPHGALGEDTFHELAENARVFSNKVMALIQDQPKDKTEINLDTGRFWVNGYVHTYGPGRIISFRNARLKGADLLQTWIQHLLLCAVSDDADTQSFCIATDKTARFSRVALDRDILSSLLIRYYQGLTRPLHFFPESSWAFASRTDKTEADAFKAARTAWEGNPYSRAEGDDPYFNMCFRDYDPLDTEFAELALAVFGPLTENLTMEKT